ncbi:MAG: TIGR04255 family protein [Vicingaceae bacterium]|nr:TIGR04255 family protein [Vicingaceae bacterium]
MENKVRNLKNAPIQEALIDFKFDLDDKLTVDKLKEFSTEKVANYPKMGDILEYNIGINLDSTINQNKLIAGVNLTKEDEGRVCQLRINGVAFNKIKGYTDWQNFISEPKQIWEDFINEFNFLKITRIGIRYINKFELQHKTDLRDDFYLLPILPKGLNEEMEGFNLEILLPNKNKNIKGLIREYIKKEDNKNFMVLDIDVFMQSNLSLNIDNIWDIFDELREFKNKIFFGSTTYKLTSKYE